MVSDLTSLHYKFISTMLNYPINDKVISIALGQDYKTFESLCSRQDSEKSFANLQSIHAFIVCFQHEWGQYHQNQFVKVLSLFNAKQLNLTPQETAWVKDMKSDIQAIWLKSVQAEQVAEETCSHFPRVVWGIIEGYEPFDGCSLRDLILLAKNNFFDPEKSPSFKGKIETSFNIVKGAFPYTNILQRSSALHDIALQILILNLCKKKDFLEGVIEEDGKPYVLEFFQNYMSNREFKDFYPPFKDSQIGDLSRFKIQNLQMKLTDKVVEDDLPKYSHLKVLSINPTSLSKQGLIKILENPQYRRINFKGTNQTLLDAIEVLEINDKIVELSFQGDVPYALLAAKFPNLYYLHVRTFNPPAEVRMPNLEIVTAFQQDLINIIMIKDKKERFPNLKFVGAMEDARKFLSEKHPILGNSSSIRPTFDFDGKLKEIKERSEKEKDGK